MTQKEYFIDNSIVIHNNKYDYSNVHYINQKTKVKIICPIHGEFEQRPSNHIKGIGCPKCGIEKMKINQSFTIKDFIKKSEKTHNKKYDYSLVEYKNNSTKIKIICSIHGVFEQTPKIHFLYGCPKCKKEELLNNKKNKFITKSNKLHNNKYIYNDYYNTFTKIKITCPIHGDFEQTPQHHLRGHGCTLCGNTKKRLKRIEQINNDKFNGNQLIPSYNKESCKIFDEIMIKENIYIQHAMNVGEYYIKELGYWVDGYDKENNVVYEYDERQHFYKGELKYKDKIRQFEIENYLNCKFVRIKK